MQKLILNWVLSVAVFLYRATGGRVGGSMNGVDVLLLTATGRKSGKKRTIPLELIRKPNFDLVLELIQDSFRISS